MGDPIESAVFPFEGLLPALDLLPLAARRALDLAGFRLSLEGWRSLSLADRKALAIAGSFEDVNLEEVFVIMTRSSPPPSKMAPTGEPDPLEPPEAMVKALAPSRILDLARWSGLRALERYALAHAYRRAVGSGAPDSFGEAFDRLLACARSTTRPESPRRYAARGAYSNVSTPPPPAPSVAIDTTRSVGPGPQAATSTGSPPISSMQRPAPSSPKARFAIRETVPAQMQVRSDVERPRSPDSPRREVPQRETSRTLSSHLDDAGLVHMIDVGNKPTSARCAVAFASVRMQATTIDLLQKGEAPKGEVLAAARIAGIMAAKRTSEIIPLCHGISLTKITIDTDVDVNRASVDVWATAEAVDRTGVEMEAMVGASIACLTIYDMLKGTDRDMVISEIKLLEKSGGRSGPYRRSTELP